ncbi:hypothetical protein C8F01DRAFT_1098993 [Mycena amicta]|nr:hypothetical protein C8F01DRAFT_1098993 [Mycena amicta]
MPVSSFVLTGPEILSRTADRTRLPALDAEIKHLENALNALHSERKLIQDRLDSYIYPVLTLPNEIVAEIFVQYLPPYPACPPLLGDGSPTKLAQICSHWRQIAHGTPALWRAIELFVSKPLSDAAQLVTMQSWLERSCTLPLSIIMGKEAYYAHLRGMALNRLLAHGPRWERVMLTIPSDNALESSVHLEGPMPLLRELDVQYDHISRLDTLFGSLHVPRLHTVFLDLYQLPHGRCPQHLPWGQLTKLFLSNTLAGTAHAILRETTDLVHCRLKLNQSASGSDSRPLHLPRLKTLMIEGNSDESAFVVEFLDTFRAPALKRFSIDEDLLWEPPSSVPPVLAAVIQSFGCRLERLSIVHPRTLEEYEATFPGIYCDYISEEWGQWDLLALYRSGA